MGLLTRTNAYFRLVEVSLPAESIAGRLRTVPYSFASSICKFRIMHDPRRCMAQNYSSKTPLSFATG